MNKDTQAYNDSQSAEDHEICNLLSREISRNLGKSENKIWHAHPVWFLEGNPIVGYSKLKNSVRLLLYPIILQVMDRFTNRESQTTFIRKLHDYD